MVKPYLICIDEPENDEPPAGTEIILTRIAALLALACCVVAGIAAVSILGRDSVPSFSSQALSDAFGQAAGPVANRAGKNDKLPVVAVALTTAAPAPATPQLDEPLRQAFASETGVFPPPAIPNIVAPVQIPPQAQKQKPDPKVAAKPPVQKTYALLSDAQIAAIRGRLNLSPSQEQYWPSVEGALRAVARKIHASRQGNPNAGGAPPIDPNSPEVQQLKDAAMPLLFQLREDQKQEVRSLARIIGLHQVAAQI
jgi:hypothetical protein